MCQTNCGWFDDYNGNKVELITSKDIKRCTKLNFTKGIPFVIKNSSSYDLRYILYIPYDDFEWNISYIKQYDQIYLEPTDSHHEKPNIQPIHTLIN